MNKQEKTALISSGINLFLTVAKFNLAALTGSIALLAESWHSLSDIFSSFIVFLALRADRRAGKERKAEEKEGRPTFTDLKKMSSVDERELTSLGRGKMHIFRPGKVEHKVAIGIGLFLIFVSYRIFGKVISPEEILLEHAMPVALGISVLALFSYLLYRFEFHIGEATDSPGLIADGYHSKIDMLASLLVVFTLISYKLDLHLDKPAAVIICLLIFTHAVHVLIHALRSYFREQEKPPTDREVIVEDIWVRFLKEKMPEHIGRLYLALARLFHLKGDEILIRKKVNLLLKVTVPFLALIVYLLSGFYMLRVNEEAIVERFGKPLNCENPLGPGLHYHLPWPVEVVNRIDTERLRRIVVGYQGREDVPAILWTNIHYRKEFPFLTGEYSFADLNLQIHYKVKGIYAYLYNCQAPDMLLSNMAYRIVRDLMGKRRFFPTITVDRDVLERKIKELLQREADNHSLGIEIVTVAFRDMHPPTDVAPAFEDVVSSHEDYETYINEAQGYSNQVIPMARGEAERVRAESSAYRNKKLVQSRGEANRFCLQLSQYEKAKDITKTRLYLEALEESLPAVNKFIVEFRKGEERPELWFYEGDLMPLFIEKRGERTGGGK